jgi:hypothetical protein
MDTPQTDGFSIDMSYYHDFRDTVNDSIITCNINLKAKFALSFISVLR